MYYIQIFTLQGEFIEGSHYKGALEGAKIIARNRANALEGEGVVRNTQGSIIYRINCYGEESSN